MVALSGLSADKTGAQFAATLIDFPSQPVRPRLILLRMLVG
jgi:hypothetical protein